jgi:hypothetical protein
MQFKLKKISGDASFREFYRVQKRSTSTILVKANKDKFKNLITYAAINKLLIDNKINPNSFLPRRERLIAYYHFTFLEILWRTRIGVNMSHEYKIWNKSLEQENQDIRRHVMKQKKQLRLKSLQANLIYSIKTNSFTIVLLKAFRAIKYKNIGLKYGSIDDCFRENLIKSYNDSSNPNELKS